jgi:hypothetical protein
VKNGRSIERCSSVAIVIGNAKKIGRNCIRAALPSARIAPEIARESGINAMCIR